MIKGERKYFELIKAQSDEDWLELRNKGVGGSDVASIMGLNKYSSPLEVWLLKTGRAESKDLSDNQAVEWGNRLESLVGEKYADMHPDRKIRRVNAVARSLDRPWAQASLDYEVIDNGRHGVLEIKTAGISRAKDWDNGVPAYYLTQIVHYMSVLNRDFADVAVLIGGNDYREYRIERDEEDIQAVNNAVDTFWNDYVLTDTMPAITNTGNEGQALAQMYQDYDDELITVDGEQMARVDDLIATYTAARDLEKEYKVQKDIASKKLEAIIGDKKGLVTDIARVTWKRSNRATFNKKQFEADHPQLAEKYTTYKATNGGINIKEI